MGEDAKTGIEVPTAAKQTEIPDKIQHEKRKFHKKSQYACKNQK